jgi:hypothetical protein
MSVLPTRAEAKEVSSGLSDNLKIDQHLTDVHTIQLRKFAFYAFNKPDAALSRRFLRFERHDHRPAGLLFQVGGQLVGIIELMVERDEDR